MGDNISDKPVILIVDDSRVIRHAASKMLADDYIVLEANNGLEAWQQLQQNTSISVVFVDMQMPEMNGLELLTHIRSADDERLASLPVIVITGAEDTENTKKRIFEAGATDFISKPFDSVDLLSRAKSYARLNRKVVELEKKTGRDKITGLYSAASFEEHGDRALSFAMRHKMHLSVISLEIVDFQDLYLAHGKRVAQQIIVAIAKRLSEVMRAEDIAARTGVARYALLLPLTSEDRASVVIERVRESIDKLVFDTGRERIRVKLASGLVTPVLEHERAFSELVVQADAALARAIELSSAATGGVGSQEDAQAKAAVTMQEVNITDALVSEAIQHVINGDFSSISDDLLRPLAERLTPFIEYVNSRPEQHPASARGTGERQ